MGAIATAQITAIAAWFAASSQDYTSPLGNVIRRGPFGTLINLATLDTAPSASLSGFVAAGVLPVYSVDAVGPGDLTTPGEQPPVIDRALHLIWAAKQGKLDGLRIPPVAVVSLPTVGTTIRQAMTAAGLSVAADRAVLAIPTYAFPTGAARYWGDTLLPNPQVRLAAALPVI